MKNRFIVPVVLFLTAAVLVRCASKESIAKTISENPDIIFDVVKKNPEKFMTAVQVAAQAAQQERYVNHEKAAQENLEKEFNNPRTVSIDTKKILTGPSNAPITIVKYADFQCPACRIGFEALEKIKQKYKDKVRMIHKNVPLESIHPLARLSAQIYESLLSSDKTKALAFYKKTYTNQGKWKTDKDLWSIAKSVGGNKKQIESDIAKGSIDAAIAIDMEDHARQGFEGTPSYIINGVALYGAQSEKDFEAVIERHLNKK